VWQVTPQQLWFCTQSSAQCGRSLKAWPHNRENHTKSSIWHKKIRMRKFEKIQTKLSSLGVHNGDDGRKITIDDKHHLIGQ